ncbi:hypothetical protein KUM39_08620 [Streptomyces sp. J2-1]|uniref:hypothetical protein n=1 Tax=Streptomyces corallincola TaxID=2851888 RepID=UPI001C3912E5|nr:hypothetical protein [Streptomyces corallincola]MBV2354426.1 hypothetical protein [Streptomyces corallincola]
MASTTADGRAASRRRSWLDKPIPESIPPRKRQLALALHSLFVLLRRHEDGNSRAMTHDMPSQQEAADRFNSDSSSLSRYLSDIRVPKAPFLRALHEAAEADAVAAGKEVGITLADLLDLHRLAVRERRGELPEQRGEPGGTCLSCHECERQLSSARKYAQLMNGKVRVLKRKNAALRTRRADARRRPETVTPLPVPHQTGDRQRNNKPLATAKQVAAQAAALNRAGRADEAFNTVRRTATELLTPVETALLILELRAEKQDLLADNLIHVYGRDESAARVIVASAALHDAGAANEAGTLLRASLR